MQELADHLGRERSDVAPVVQAFVNDGILDWDLDYGPTDEEVGIDVTPKGMDALEAWTFALEQDEGDWLAADDEAADR